MKKKVLINLPHDNVKHAKCLPFLKTLLDEFNDWERDFIFNEGSDNFAGQLFVGERFWPIPKDRDNFFQLHHFAVNLIDVFNIDLYINLDTTLKSDFLGLYFRSKARIGCSHNGRSFLYTHKTPKELSVNGRNFEYSLLGNYLGKILSSPSRLSVDSIPKWYGSSPFMLTYFKDDKSLEFKERFPNEEFINLFDFLPEEKKEPLLNHRMIYEFPKERLAEYIIHSKAFFTDDLSKALFASSLSVQPFYFNDEFHYQEIFTSFPSPIKITPWTEIEGPDGVVPIKDGEYFRKLILGSL